MKRLNKEYKLDVCKHISLKYGTVNRNNPQVVYVSGKCWVSPLRNMNYADVISNIEKEMRRNSRNRYRLFHLKRFSDHSHSRRHRQKAIPVTGKHARKYRKDSAAVARSAPEGRGTGSDLSDAREAANCRIT